MAQQLRLIVRSVHAAWLSLRLSLARLGDQERRALRRHVQDMRERAAVVGDAGDAETLLRDQLELMPGSRERVRANAADVHRIVAELLADWRSIWRELRRQLSD